MSKKYKFPKATERSEAKPAVLCPGDRVLNLYNQDSGKEAKRISKAVREWFTEKSLAEGWSAVGFLPEVQSQHGAGCILIKDTPGTKGNTLVKKLGSSAE